MPKFSFPKFLARAREVHGDRYQYHEIESNLPGNKAKITCPDHGDFIQRRDMHLKGQHCRYCGYANRSEPVREETPRSRAIAAGDPTYETGKPCPKGHIAARRTHNSECVECSVLDHLARYEFYKKSDRNCSPNGRAGTTKITKKSIVTAVSDGPPKTRKRRKPAEGVGVKPTRPASMTWSRIGAAVTRPRCACRSIGPDQPATTLSVLQLQQGHPHQ